MMNQTYLIHFGILGMEHGKRNGPPYPLDSGDHSSKEKSAAKSAGVKVGQDSGKGAIENLKSNVRAAKTNVKSANKAYNNAYTNKAQREASQQMVVANSDLKKAKRDLSDEKVRQKISQRTSVSKHQQKLIEQYKQKGLTQEEAEIQAYKRARTEKAVAAVAGLTLAAAVAYVGYKHYDKNVDKILDSKTVLNNVSTDKDVLGVRDAVYVSFNKKDNSKYQGMLAKTWSSNNKVYNTEIGVNKPIKIASEKTGLKTARELLADKDYKDKVRSQIDSTRTQMLIGGGGSPKQRDMLRKAIKDLDNGKVTSDVYNAMNIHLVDHTQRGQEISNKFYDALKNKGYHGVGDINDKYLSGYNSKSATILFDKSGIMTKNVSELTNNVIDKNNTKWTNRILARESAKALAPNVAAIAGAGAGIRAALKVSNKRNERNERNQVQKYRKDHPDSKMSYNEIVNMLETSKYRK